MQFYVFYLRGVNYIFACCQYIREMFAFLSFPCCRFIVEKSRSTNMFILKIVCVGHTLIADKRSQSSFLNHWIFPSDETLTLSSADLQIRIRLNHENAKNKIKLRNWCGITFESVGIEHFSFFLSNLSLRIIIQMLWWTSKKLCSFLEFSHSEFWLKCIPFYRSKLSQIPSSNLEKLKPNFDILNLLNLTE